MGKHFGNLAKIRGIVYYKISSRELKPFALAISHGLPNFVPRAGGTVFKWLPCLLATIAVYTGVEDAYRRKLRKNPLDYVNEVDPNASESDEKK